VRVRKKHPVYEATVNGMVRCVTEGQGKVPVQLAGCGSVRFAAAAAVFVDIAAWTGLVIIIIPTTTVIVARRRTFLKVAATAATPATLFHASAGTLANPVAFAGVIAQGLVFLAGLANSPVGIKP
jgi:hypothetical protein